MTSNERQDAQQEEARVLTIFDYKPLRTTSGIKILTREYQRPTVTYPRSMHLHHVQQLLKNTPTYEQQLSIYRAPIANAIQPNDTFYGCIFHFTYPTTLQRESQLTKHVARIVSPYESNSFEAQYIAYRLLKELLRAKAKEILPRIVHAEAESRGLKVNRIFIKDSVSRHGSCSSRGNINLNFMLLLYPKWAVRYVVLHELAHLSYMDHGEEFWALLSHYLQEDAHATDRAMQEVKLPLPLLFPFRTA